MIGQLRGVVASTTEDSALIDCNGVGYEVSATPRLLDRLEIGATVTLAIDTLVAETYIRLVGFSSADERAAFRLLQTVQGVGARAALAILQVLTPAALSEAVAFEDKTAIAKAQGVGPKLAARIISELAGKVVFASPPGAQLTTAAATAGPAANADAPSARIEAVSALINLGYDEATARRAVSAVPANADETVEALLPLALREAAS